MNKWVRKPIPESGVGLLRLMWILFRSGLQNLAITFRTSVIKLLFTKR